MSESIAAVVVTYNRAKLLLECLDSLLGQTRVVDRIFLIDNASSDGTPTLLSEKGYLANPRVEYVRMTSNTGGAGGFHEGIRRAAEAKFDWLWVMDDDAEPTLSALSQMAPHFKDPANVGVASLIVGIDGEPQLNHRGWIDPYREAVSESFVWPIQKADLVSALPVQFASFVGLAFRSTAVNEIGLPKKEFFIHHDDVDFCMRLGTLGTIKLVPSSVILHKDAAKAVTEVVRTFVGRTSARVPIERLWLKFYSLRNSIWLRRRVCKKSFVLMYAARRLFPLLIGTLLYDDYKMRRARFWLAAVIDGWNGTFDNEKPKRISTVQ